MIVILDLDYTLLDTAKFKDALAVVFASCGVDRKSFDRAYKKTVTARPPEYDYDIDRHIGYLEEHLTCNVEKLKGRVNELLKSVDDHLYPGARDFVERLRVGGARLVLLTLGNEFWQRIKMEHSTLSDMFDRIVTVGSGKEDVVGDIAKGHDKVVVINDNVDEIFRMLETNPTFLYIVKRGPRGVPGALDIPVCDSFEDILEVMLLDS
ncbi:MAG: HAD hydrolase-like protein [Patescibacteria group bacterium]|nr:HAD hydrolase-like protein [Patescibacteria group bacterium]